MKRLALLATLAALSACTLYHGPSASLPSKNGIVAGETITVKTNENIYGVAREHNVSMRELIVLNDLKPPFEIKPGQSLTLPATDGTFNGNMPVPAAAPLDTVEQKTLAPLDSPVSSEELAPIAATSAPPATAASTAPQSLTPPPQSAAPAAVPAPASAAALSEPVRELNRPAPAPKPIATTAPAAAPVPASVVAAPLPAATGGAGAPLAVAATPINMIWPVQGPVLSGFGAKGPGLNNDGVNISAPKGAPVVAAAPGTVVYAGDDMKGFGNLVLIRHEGDWVTAYSHLDRVLVKKDTVVGQGDMIGTVGKTGNVTTPQLHFETRQSGHPVDPASVVKDKS